MHGTHVPERADARDDWISISDAALRLSDGGDIISRPALSRYLKQHAEALPLKPAGKSNLVEFGALVAHRGENIRIRAMPNELRPADARRPVRRFEGSQADGNAVKAQFDGKIRALEYAKLVKDVVPVREVDNAARDALALMKAAFDRSYQNAAETLSGKYGWDERTVRVALKYFAGIGLGVFHKEIVKRIDELTKEPTDADDAAI